MPDLNAPTVDLALTRQEIGIARSAAAAGDDWKREAVTVLRRYCRNNEYVFVDDLDLQRGFDPKTQLPFLITIEQSSPPVDEVSETQAPSRDEATSQPARPPRRESEPELPAVVPERAEPEPGAQLARGALGRGTGIRLVDEEDVWQLEHARLHELEHVARAGLRDEDRRVDLAGDVGLRLPDAHGLDEHHVEHGRQHLDAGVRGIGEAAQPVARRHRADEDAGIARARAHPRGAGHPPRR